MSPTFLSSFDEQREANKVDGGCDSQRADESEHETHQPGETQHQLEQRGHQDGSLNLGVTGTIQNGIKVGKRRPNANFYFNQVYLD